MNLQQHLSDADATVELGQRLAKALSQATIIYLQGDLGAGKTTLTRGIMRAMGHEGKVKSPTYTLVEPYQIGHWQINHFDLYRLADPEELEFIGIRDYFVENCVSIVEWPDKGEGMLPKPDLEIHLSYAGVQRQATLCAHSAIGETVITKLANR